MQTVQAERDFERRAAGRLRAGRDGDVFFNLVADRRRYEREVERLRRSSAEERGNGDEDARVKGQSVHRVASDEVLVRVSESARKHAVGAVPAEKAGDRGGVRI